MTTKSFVQEEDMAESQIDVGDIFLHRPSGEYYILARVMEGHYVLICLNDGFCWLDAVDPIMQECGDFHSVLKEIKTSGFEKVNDIKFIIR